MICARCGHSPIRDTAVTCPECRADPRLDGRYRLERLLGQGTHGMTYKATRGDGVDVAVKMVNLGHGVDLTRRAALDREVAVLRQLDHPRIPAMLDDFTVRSGMTRYRCIVQTFIDGDPLTEALQQKRPSVADVMGMVAELAEVLSWLHGLAPPIIHRDLKPQNVLRRRSDGALVLIDFGSVRDTIVETLGGTMGVGTAGYMAPEQIIGDVRPASDLYALGAMTIELLTRRQPFELREKNGRLNWSKDHFPPAVAAFVDRLVDPDPDQRYSDASEVQAIAERLSQDPDDAPPELAREAEVAEAAPVALEPPPPGAPLYVFTDSVDRELEARRMEALELEAQRNALRVSLTRPSSVRLGLGTLTLAAFVATGGAFIEVGIPAWIGVLSPFLSAVMMYMAVKLGARSSLRAAAAAFVTAVGLIVAVNAFGIRPDVGRWLFPLITGPVGLWMLGQTRRWVPELAAIEADRQRALAEIEDGLQPTVQVQAPVVERWQDLRGHPEAATPGPWLWALTAGSFVGAGFAFQDVESIMATGPILGGIALLGRWLKGKQGNRVVREMGLLTPAMALIVFLVIAIGEISPSEASHWVPHLMMGWGFFSALQAVRGHIVGRLPQRAPDDDQGALPPG